MSPVLEKNLLHGQYPEWCRHSERSKGTASGANKCTQKCKNVLAHNFQEATKALDVSWSLYLSNTDSVWDSTYEEMSALNICSHF